MKKPALEEKIEVRISAGDCAAIRQVSAQLALPQSEITRRAIRIGLGELRGSSLPGSSAKFENRESAHGS